MSLSCGLTCGLCGTRIAGAYFMSAGIAYHFNQDCQVSAYTEFHKQPKTITEEDVRRIVREEMADTQKPQDLMGLFGIAKDK